MKKLKYFLQGNSIEMPWNDEVVKEVFVEVPVEKAEVVEAEVVEPVAVETLPEPPLSGTAGRMFGRSSERGSLAALEAAMLELMGVTENG